MSSGESRSRSRGPDGPSTGEASAPPDADDSENGTAPTTAGPDSPGVAVDNGPLRPLQAVSILSAVVAAATTTPFTTLSLPFGVAGVFVLVGSITVRASVGWLTAGVGLIGTGAIVAGGFGVVPPAVFVLAVGAVAVAWDAGQYGIVLGEQLGRQAPSRRLQLVHVASTVLVVTVAGGVAYFGYLFGSGGRPGAAVALVVLGAVGAAWVFRR